MKADLARTTALAALLRTPLGRVEKDASGAGPAAARARELFAGVRRHLFTIDAALERYVPHGVMRIEPRLLEALRLGAYQILYEREVPRPLVVASTVALAGPSAKRRGFLNAVLRRFASEVVAEEAEVPLRARDAVITGRRSIARFPAPVLPDPETDLVGHLSAQFTQTPWFIEAAMREVGDEIDALLLALMLPLPVAVRVNRLRSDPSAVEAALRACGASVLRGFGDVLEMRYAGSIADCPPFREGLMTVQDVVASEVARFVDPRPGERILDLCAGTGGKSTHMAELAGGHASIVAADVNALQLGKLGDNVRRLQTPGVEPLLLDGGALGMLPPFDRVLVDAPCSNSGVLMKRVAARFRLDPDSVASLARMQLDLLERGAGCVRPGGVLVYSTCSILPHENGAVVQRFLDRSRGAFALEASRTSYPHRTGRDGGFMARLRKAVPEAPGDQVAGAPAISAR